MQHQRAAKPDQHQQTEFTLQSEWSLFFTHNTTNIW